MAIAFDAATTDGWGNVAASPRNITHAGGSGSNRVAFVAVCYSDKAGTPGNVSITGVTYGGAAMTAIIGPIQRQTGYVRVYGLIAPAAGSQTVAVSYTATTNDPIIAHVLTYTGVDQSTGWQNATSANNTNAGPLSVTVTSATGNLVLSFGALTESSAALTASGTQRANSTTTANGDPIRLGSEEYSGAASVSAQWTIGATAHWVNIGLDLIASGGAASRTLFYSPGLDGLSTAGPKQFNPSLG